MSKPEIDIDAVYNNGCILGIVVLLGAALIGWVWNIGKLVAAVADPISLLTLMRIVGIPVVPLGCVIGWF